MRERERELINMACKYTDKNMYRLIYINLKNNVEKFDKYTSHI